tara:strand:+ start:2087 stop:4060 length:1974 start_codon:yes stop_codon:yes gene_type:complete
MNPEDFFHSTGTTVYTDYDPATRTVKVQRGGVMGMSDAGRMSVDRLMDETDISGTSDDGLSIRRGNYDPQFAQAFQQFEAAQPTLPQTTPSPKGFSYRPEVTEGYDQIYTSYSDYDPVSQTVKKKTSGGMLGRTFESRVNVNDVRDPKFAEALQQFQAGQGQPQTTPNQPVTTQPSPDATQPPVQSSLDVRMSRMPYAASVVRDDTSMDPILQQLLYGTGGIGGFVPGAMRAAERTFFDSEGRPIVIPELAAEFTPDQLVAQQLARQQVGSFQPFAGAAESAFRRGIGSLSERQEQQLEQAQKALAVQEEAAKAADTFGIDLTEAADVLRGTGREFDPTLTDRFYDPFEKKVVQQTVEDALEGLAKSDIAARQRDILQGGESAFGSRARLSAAERAEALGKGLAQQLSGIRSRGFLQAQSAAQQELARQEAAERAKSTGLAGLAGQRLTGTLSSAGQLAQGYGQLGNVQGSIGQQQAAAQGAFGQQLTGLGQQVRGNLQQDISGIAGSGAQQQQQTQRELDMQRRALMQAQQAPLQQFQALQPFVAQGIQGAGRGSQVRTQFTPPPNPLTAGLGVGLSALGTVGNLAYPRPTYGNEPINTVSNPVTGINQFSRPEQPVGFYGANPNQFYSAAQPVQPMPMPNPYNQPMPGQTRTLSV